MSNVNSSNASTSSSTWVNAQKPQPPGVTSEQMVQVVQQCALSDLAPEQQFTLQGLDQSVQLEIYQLVVATAGMEQTTQAGNTNVAIQNIKNPYLISSNREGFNDEASNTKMRDLDGYYDTRTEMEQLQEDTPIPIISGRKHQTRSLCLQ